MAPPSENPSGKPADAAEPSTSTSTSQPATPLDPQDILTQFQEMQSSLEAKLNEAAMSLLQSAFTTKMKELEEQKTELERRISTAAAATTAAQPPKKP